MSQQISEILKAKLNIHGELHLDAYQAGMLVSWLRSQEEYVSQTGALMKRISAEFADAKKGLSLEKEEKARTGIGALLEAIEKTQHQADRRSSEDKPGFR